MNPLSIIPAQMEVILPSRISRGFGRLAITISSLVILLSAYFGWIEFSSPSGVLVVDLPEGTLAWEPTRHTKAENDIANSLIAEQRSSGIVAPPGYIILGVPIEVVKNNNLEWTKFQFRDGREVGIQATNAKKITDTAGNFLWAEKVRRRNFTDKDYVEFEGVRVTYLNPYDQFPSEQNVWSKHRLRDWTWVLLTLCLGVASYLAIRSIGWVIDGFGRNQSN